jgi:hypothetical protein
MHRSYSTPCLSPKGKECQQHNQSKVIEILVCSSPSATMKELVKDIIKGITNGVDPVAVTRGIGGAYYFWDIWGNMLQLLNQPMRNLLLQIILKVLWGRLLGNQASKDLYGLVRQDTRGSPYTSLITRILQESLLLC